MVTLNFVLIFFFCLFISLSAMDNGDYKQTESAFTLLEKASEGNLKETETILKKQTFDKEILHKAFLLAKGGRDVEKIYIEIETDLDVHKARYRDFELILAEIGKAIAQALI